MISNARRYLGLLFSTSKRASKRTPFLANTLSKRSLPSLTLLPTHSFQTISNSRNDCMVVQSRFVLFVLVTDRYYSVHEPTLEKSTRNSKPFRVNECIRTLLSSSVDNKKVYYEMDRVLYLETGNNRLCHSTQAFDSCSCTHAYSWKLIFRFGIVAFICSSASVNSIIFWKSIFIFPKRETFM